MTEHPSHGGNMSPDKSPLLEAHERIRELERERDEARAETVAAIADITEQRARAITAEYQLDQAMAFLRERPKGVGDDAVWLAYWRSVDDFLSPNPTEGT